MKLKYFDIDEVQGNSAAIGAWVGGGLGVLCAIAGFVEGDIVPAIAVLILGSLLFALGGALAGWIIGWIIKLVAKCLPMEERKTEKTKTDTNIWRRNEYMDEVTDKWAKDLYDSINK